MERELVLLASTCSKFFRKVIDLGAVEKEFKLHDTYCLSISVLRLALKAVLTLLVSTVPAEQEQIQALDSLYEIAKTLPPTSDIDITLLKLIKGYQLRLRTFAEMCKWENLKWPGSFVQFRDADISALALRCAERGELKPTVSIIKRHFIELGENVLAILSAIDASTPLEDYDEIIPSFSTFTSSEVFVAGEQATTVQPRDYYELLRNDVVLPAPPKILSDQSIAQWYVKRIEEVTDKANSPALGKKLFEFFQYHCEGAFSLYLSVELKDTLNMLFDVLSEFHKRGLQDISMKVLQEYFCTVVDGSIGEFEMTPKKINNFISYCLSRDNNIFRPEDILLIVLSSVPLKETMALISLPSKKDITKIDPWTLQRTCVLACLYSQQTEWSIINELIDYYDSSKIECEELSLLRALSECNTIVQSFGIEHCCAYYVALEKAELLHLLSQIAVRAVHANPDTLLSTLVRVASALCSVSPSVKEKYFWMESLSKEKHCPPLACEVSNAECVGIAVTQLASSGNVQAASVLISKSSLSDEERASLAKQLYKTEKVLFNSSESLHSASLERAHDVLQLIDECHFNDGALSKKLTFERKLTAAARFLRENGIREVPPLQLRLVAKDKKFKPDSCAVNVVVPSAFSASPLFKSIGSADSLQEVLKVQNAFSSEKAILIESVIKQNKGVLDNMPDFEEFVRNLHNPDVEKPNDWKFYELVADYEESPESKSSHLSEALRTCPPSAFLGLLEKWKKANAELEVERKVRYEKEESGTYDTLQSVIAPQLGRQQGSFCDYFTVDPSLAETVLTNLDEKSKEKEQGLVRAFAHSLFRGHRRKVSYNISAPELYLYLQKLSDQQRALKRVPSKSLFDSQKGLSADLFSSIIEHPDVGYARSFLRGEDKTALAKLLESKLSQGALDGTLAKCLADAKRVFESTDLETAEVTATLKLFSEVQTAVELREQCGKPLTKDEIASILARPEELKDLFADYILENFADPVSDPRCAELRSSVFCSAVEFYMHCMVLCIKKHYTFQTPNGIAYPSQLSSIKKSPEECIVAAKQFHGELFKQQSVSNDRLIDFFALISSELQSAGKDICERAENSPFVALFEQQNKLAVRLNEKCPAVPLYDFLNLRTSCPQDTESRKENALRLLAPLLDESTTKQLSLMAKLIGEYLELDPVFFKSKNLLSTKAKLALSDNKATPEQVIAAFKTCADEFTKEQYWKYALCKQIPPSERLAVIVDKGIERGFHELEPLRSTLALLVQLELTDKTPNYHKALDVVESALCGEFDDVSLQPPCTLFAALAFFAAHGAPVLAVLHVIVSCVPDVAMGAYKTLFSEICRCLFTTILDCRTSSPLVDSELTDWIPDTEQKALGVVEALVASVHGASQSISGDAVLADLLLSSREKLAEFLEAMASEQGYGYAERLKERLLATPTAVVNTSDASESHTASVNDAGDSALDDEDGWNW